MPFITDEEKEFLQYVAYRLNEIVARFLNDEPHKVLNFTEYAKKNRV